LACGDAYLVAFDLDDFLDHNGVGPVRHHRAGHDAHAFALAQLAGELPSGESAAGDAQLGVSSGFQIGMAQGVAVHGGVVVRGHVERGNDVLAEHASEGRPYGNPFIGGDRGEEGADDRARLVHR